jgi:hypothetical protein
MKKPPEGGFDCKWWLGAELNNPKMLNPVEWADLSDGR